MANVVFDKVTKIYSNGFEAVHGIDLEVKDGEFMVMVGPSGCAKSTTLRMLAGLETISGGTITIGDKIVNNLAPKDRGIAMVFQNYALYPHMTVRDNLGFGLRLAGLDKKVIEEYVDEAAELLEITPLLDRLPRQLSGGQAQRVAVGRAIVKKPVVFLFDEPLSNLDAKLRASMRVRISDLHKRLKQSNKPATTVYVTHDQTEAMTMGDRICVLKDGHIYQVDTPSNLYKYPKNLFVAGFIGAPEMNLVETTINSEGDSTYLQFTGAKLKLNPEKSKKISDRAHSSNVVLGVRPEFISLANPEDLADTIIDATVTRLENMGSEYYVHIDLEGKPMCSRIPTAIVEERLLGSEGTIKSFYLDMAHCHIFDKESEENISL